jgi:TolA-binding protein
VRPRLSLAVLLFLLACGSSQTTATVEIAPLPLPTATATQTAAVTLPVATTDEPDDERDLRRHSARTQALLVTELQQLEQLLATVATTSPDRPALLRRLAEDYVELRKAAPNTAAAASRKAIDRYETLTREYPNYPLSDEVLYYLALEHETLHDMMNARRTYYDLIKRYPSSSFIPYAYFAFGEMFFHEASSDPTKWDFAKQAYTEVIKFSQAALVPEAWYKLSLVYKAQGDTAHAEQAKQKILATYPKSRAASRF